MQFPKNFLWGAATSSYQVEGDNPNADWWEWEKMAGKENSGRACGHYELYAQDFDLAKDLNHNAHRLSIEWSRIEPQEGKFSQKELQHYIDVILALRARNIEPMVTLHHFTSPIWLSAKQGWENDRVVPLFLRFSDFVVRGLAKHVRYWITINEPTVYTSHAYVIGAWPPQQKSYWKARSVYDHFVAGHIQVYRRIHQIYQEFHLPSPMVSISQHLQAFVPCAPKKMNAYAVSLRDQWYNFDFLDQIRRQKAIDFIGLNYYSRQLVDVQRFGIGNLAWDVCKNNCDPVKKNSLGWDIYPQGMKQVLLKTKRFNLPVIITENGICTSDDELRWEYVHGHLKNVYLAIQEGVNVTGYLYWSLLDNFEWDKGFGPRFGLIDIDYSTLKRTVRDSARKYAEVCKTGVLPDSHV